MPMLLGSGKELFQLLCEKFSELKFIASGKTSVESVAIELPKELKEELGLPNKKVQLAAIQYKGGKKKILDGEVDAVLLRLYLAPLKALGIDQIIEEESKHRSSLIQNGDQPYYEYKYNSPASEVIGEIDQLFLKISEGLKGNMGSIYNDLVETEVPEWVRELPRY